MPSCIARANRGFGRPASPRQRRTRKKQNSTPHFTQRSNRFSLGELAAANTKGPAREWSCRDASDIDGLIGEAENLVHTRKELRAVMSVATQSLWSSVCAN